MNKLTVAVSPLTGTIFCGRILKSGLWAAGKQDVTIECLEAVVGHALRFGKPIEISSQDGKLLYKITVDRF